METYRTNPLFCGSRTANIAALRDACTLSAPARELLPGSLSAVESIILLNPSEWLELRNGAVLNDPWVLANSTPQPPLDDAEKPPDMSKAYPCPGCYILIKYKSYKSKRWENLVKVREVITHAKHPWRRASRVFGRALTLFWKATIRAAGNSGGDGRTVGLGSGS